MSSHHPPRTIVRIDVHDPETGKIVWGPTNGLLVSIAGKGCNPKDKITVTPNPDERCWDVELQPSVEPPVLCVTCVVDGVASDGSVVRWQDPAGTGLVDIGKAVGDKPTIHMCREIGFLERLSHNRHKHGEKTWRHVTTSVLVVRYPGEYLAMGPGEVLEYTKKMKDSDMPLYTEAPSLQDDAFFEATRHMKSRARAVDTPKAVKAVSAQFPPGFLVALNHEYKVGEYTHLSERTILLLADAVACTNHGGYARQRALDGNLKNEKDSTIAQRIMDVLDVEEWDTESVAEFVCEMACYTTSSLGKYSSDRLRMVRDDVHTVSEASEAALRSPVSDTNQPMQNTMSGDCENSGSLNWLMMKAILNFAQTAQTPLLQLLAGTVADLYQPCIAAVTASAPARTPGQNKNVFKGATCEEDLLTLPDEGSRGLMAHVVALLVPRRETEDLTCLIMEGTAWEAPNPFGENSAEGATTRFEQSTAIGQLLRGKDGYGETPSDNAWEFYDTIACVGGWGETDEEITTCYLVCKGSSTNNWTIGASMHDFCRWPNAEAFALKSIDTMKGASDENAMRESIKNHAIASRWCLSDLVPIVATADGDVHTNYQLDAHSPYLHATEHLVNTIVKQLLIPRLVAIQTSDWTVDDKDALEEVTVEMVNRMRAYIVPSVGGLDRWVNCTVPAFIKALYTDDDGTSNSKEYNAAAELIADVINKTKLLDDIELTEAVAPLTLIESASNMCDLLTAFCVVSAYLRTEIHETVSVFRRRTYVSAVDWTRELVKDVAQDATDPNNVFVSARFTAVAPIAGVVAICIVSGVQK